MSWLPARMKKIRSKMKALEYLQDYMTFFFFFRRGILPKFELIQAFIVVLVTCKNEEDPIKNEGTRMLTRFSPL